VGEARQLRFISLSPPNKRSLWSEVPSRLGQLSAIEQL
jgi:hypothetical protein